MTPTQCPKSHLSVWVLLARDQIPCPHLNVPFDEGDARVDGVR